MKIPIASVLFHLKGWHKHHNNNSNHHNRNHYLRTIEVRTFRRAGNACEIVAGSCLNSAVIFTFHLLQVHPVGMFLAVGTAHLYFTATATGEGFNNFVTNLMTGCSASCALLCALSDPIGEWNEARTSTQTANHEIEQMYLPKTADYSNWGSGATIAIVIAILMIFLFGGRKSK